MIKENKAEFEKSNLLTWHNAGYKGQGITIVVLDDRGMPLEQDNVIVPFPEEHREYNHNSSVCNVIRQVAPECRIVSMPWFGGVKKEIIDWIVEHKDEIDLINCSFAGVVGANEFNRLKDLDIPVICASGNAGKEDWISKPASYDWTIAIGAVGEANGHVTWYSNKGEELYAVAYTNIYIYNSKGKLFMFGGTSCSSPFACGLVVCYLSWRKENNLRRLHKEEVRDFIGENAFDMYELGHDYKSGYGLVMLPDEIPVVDVEVPKEDDNMAGKDFFTDDDGRWSEEFNNELAELGILEGDGKGNFRPTDVVTREELSKVAVLLRRKILAEIRGE